MIKIIRLTPLVVLATFLSGCSNLPDAIIGYYLAKTEVSFKVVRTVACDAKNHLIVVNSSTPIVTHSANREQFETIRLSELKGWFWDNDVNFQFYEDGRLKGVNSSITGKGETILKTVTTVAAAVIASKGQEACKFIEDNGGGKPLTLTYEGKVDMKKSAEKKQKIPPNPASIFYATELASAIGDVYAVFEGSEVPKEKPVNYVAQTGDVLLKARQPGLVKIKVIAAGENINDNDITIWEGDLPVAQFGKDYLIPVPGPPIFGKEVLDASFDESGALTSLQYTNNTGAGQALNIADSVLTALKGETTAQKAANVKAEADLILQQKRLAQCLADPTNCK